MAFITIEGTISRVFYNGKGAEVTESFKKRDGSEGTKRYTLWFQSEHGLAEGSTGKFSGMLGVDVDEWTDKENNVRHTAKVSVNGARVEGGRASTQQPQDEPWATNTPAAAPSAPDTWNAPQSTFPTDTPF